MNWGNYGYGFGMGFGPIFMIIFWVVIIIGAVYLVKLISSSSRQNRLKEPEETASDILKKRYAKGEISKEEFEEMKKNIQ
jgi:putative membrane protein